MTYRILIVGENSYIGNSFKEYIENEKKNDLKSHNIFMMNFLNSINYIPNKEDFKNYDVVLNVAGIAHVKENNKNRDLYFKINRDFAIDVAKTAKKAGVKQYILLSTMAVYGLNEGKITKNTIEKPITAYSLSKFQADKEIFNLSDDNFKFACIRPPMVYGKNCKGNYQALRKFVLHSLIFPNLKNERSMIYIGNLCEFIKTVIIENKKGIFFPQNKEYVSTSHMARKISELYNRKIYFTKIFNLFIKIIPSNYMKKIFGDLIYEKIDLVDKYTFNESLELTEMSDEYFTEN